jgi:hypothetical protein
VIIDGYTQPGAAQTLAVGNNANILIELNGDSCDGVCGQGCPSAPGSTVKAGYLQGASIMGSK